MTETGRIEAVGSEVDRADVEIKAAELLLDGGLCDVATTRVYFAMFHLVRALVFEKDLEPKTHEGVHHLFNLHWVRPKAVEPRWNMLVSSLLAWRQQSDYAPGWVPDEERIRSALKEVREFQAIVQDLLATK